MLTQNVTLVFHSIFGIIYEHPIKWMPCLTALQLFDLKYLFVEFVKKTPSNIE